jgi:hypothetical protein
VLKFVLLLYLTVLASSLSTSPGQKPEMNQGPYNHQIPTTRKVRTALPMSKVAARFFLY